MNDRFDGTNGRKCCSCLPDSTMQFQSVELLYSVSVTEAVLLVEKHARGLRCSLVLGFYSGGALEKA